MARTFRARCTAMEGGFVNPDVVEIYNVDNPTEIYPAGRNQFKINQSLSDEDFYLEPFAYGDERWWVAFRK